MSAIDSGGPFHAIRVPTKCNEYGAILEADVYTGASLRDVIAMRMLPVVYYEYHAGITRGDHSGDPEWRMGLSLDAYAMADAMLIARKEKAP